MLRLLRWLVVAVLAAGVAALLAVMFWLPPNDQDSFTLVRERTQRHAAYRLKKPLPGAEQTAIPLDERLKQGGFKLGSPIFVRVYKLNFELEVWMQRGTDYALFATYPVCTFSGQLGPKLKHWDMQSPEGVYMVDRKLLNPVSAHHRAFNLGFPNAFDRQLGRTGSLLEIHGGCSSIGCYAITNPAIDDLYRLATAAFTAGQPAFQVQALPFRMTADAMAVHAKHPQAAFWADLKTVADAFDAHLKPPAVSVCNGHYSLQDKVPAGSSCQSI